MDRLDLPAELAARIDAWLAAARERVAPGLSLPEVRKAVQAVSSLYVERRPSSGLGAKTGESAGKRAALASYYAPLHLLLAMRAAGEIAPAARAAIRRIHDLGCGTGAAGAGLALGLGSSPEIEGVDRAGWALREARHTFAAFGLRGRTRRAAVPDALPRLRAGDALVLGWMTNELEQDARMRLLAFVEEAVAHGHALVVLEPVARRIAPWWPSWAAALGPRGVADLELRTRAPLPEWVAALDVASGLDHSELVARAFVAPVAAPGAAGGPAA